MSEAVSEAAPGSPVKSSVTFSKFCFFHFVCHLILPIFPGTFGRLCYHLSRNVSVYFSPSEIMRTFVKYIFHNTPLLIRFPALIRSCGLSENTFSSYSPAEVHCMIYRSRSFSRHKRSIHRCSIPDMQNFGSELQLPILSFYQEIGKGEDTIMTNRKKLPKGITYRKDGRYMWRFSHNRHTYCGYASRLSDAEKGLLDARYRVENGIYGKESSHTMDEWFNVWLETFKAAI